VFSLGEEDAYVAWILKVQALVAIIVERTGASRACEICAGKCLAGAIMVEEKRCIREQQCLGVGVFGDGIKGRVSGSTAGRG
jgi:hypothetical protein